MLRAADVKDGGGVMAIFAHPDDESLLAGGTLAACAAAGERVEVLCMTRGGHGPGASEATLPERREAELCDACAILGIAEVVCLDHPDGGLLWIDHEAAVSDLAARLHSCSPRVVITFGDEGLYWHDDHVAVHRLVGAASDRVIDEAATAVYGATWPLGLAADLAEQMHRRGLPADLWGIAPEAFGVPSEAITNVVDARGFLEVKLRALRAHRTQISPGNLLYEVPLDLAAGLLGHEHFVHLRGHDDPLARLRSAGPVSG